MDIAYTPEIGSRPVVEVTKTAQAITNYPRVGRPITARLGDTVLVGRVGEQSRPESHVDPTIRIEIGQRTAEFGTNIPVNIWAYIRDGWEFTLGHETIDGLLEELDEVAAAAQAEAVPA